MAGLRGAFPFGSSEYRKSCGDPALLSKSQRENGSPSVSRGLGTAVTAAGGPAVRGPRPRPGAALGSPAASCSPRRPGARTPPDDHCALTGSSNCWPSVAHTLLAHGTPSLLTGRYALGVLSPRMQKGKPRHGAGGWRWQTEAPHTRGAEVRAPAPYTFLGGSGPGQALAATTLCREQGPWALLRASSRGSPRKGSGCGHSPASSPG